jgi:hypothetical protein
MNSLCKWLLGMPNRYTKQSLTQTNQSRWYINTIRSPDDEHLMLETCREMKWINKDMRKCIMLVINKNFNVTYILHLFAYSYMCITTFFRSYIYLQILNFHSFLKVPDNNCFLSWNLFALLLYLSFESRFAPDDIKVWLEQNNRKDIYHWTLVPLDFVDSGSNLGWCINLDAILPMFGG